jgi:hypothetical protein
MSKDVIRRIFKNDTLSLVECKDGYWLYDYVLGMNISMRAKTEQDAFIESLLYYQQKLEKTKLELQDINTKVYHFIAQFDN